MGIAPAPQFPERAPHMYEMKAAGNMEGPWLAIGASAGPTPRTKARC
jgi:hypothetical protein